MFILCNTILYLIRLIRRRLAKWSPNNPLYPHCCAELETHEDLIACTRVQMPDEEVLYDVAELFKVFGDSTRIRILSALLDHELCVCDLAELLGMGQSAISHQLRILRTAGLVRPRRDGKTMYYALDDEHVHSIFAAGLQHILHKRGAISL